MECASFVSCVDLVYSLIGRLALPGAGQVGRLGVPVVYAHPTRFPRPSPSCVVDPIVPYLSTPPLTHDSQCLQNNTAMS